MKTLTLKEKIHLVDKLKVISREEDLSQSQISRMTGIGSSLISNYLCDKALPTGGRATDLQVFTQLTTEERTQLIQKKPKQERNSLKDLETRIKALEDIVLKSVYLKAVQ